MEYLVEPQGIETRWDCGCFLGINTDGDVNVGVCVPNTCGAHCESLCGGQVCSPRMDPMLLN